MGLGRKISNYVVGSRTSRMGIKSRRCPEVLEVATEAFPNVAGSVGARREVLMGSQAVWTNWTLEDV